MAIHNPDDKLLRWVFERAAVATAPATVRHATWQAQQGSATLALWIAC
jgi:hypothetical protein